MCFPAVTNNAGFFFCLIVQCSSLWKETHWYVALTLMALELQVPTAACYRTPHQAPLQILILHWKLLSHLIIGEVQKKKKRKLNCAITITVELQCRSLHAEVQCRTHTLYPFGLPNICKLGPTCKMEIVIFHQCWHLHSQCSSLERKDMWPSIRKIDVF